MKLQGKPQEAAEITHVTPNKQRRMYHLTYLDVS